MPSPRCKSLEFVLLGRLCFVSHLGYLQAALFNGLTERALHRSIVQSLWFSLVYFGMLVWSMLTFVFVTNKTQKMSSSRANRWNFVSFSLINAVFCMMKCEIRLFYVIKPVIRLWSFVLAGWQTKIVRQSPQTQMVCSSFHVYIIWAASFQTLLYCLQGQSISFSDIHVARLRNVSFALYQTLLTYSLVRLGTNTFWCMQSTGLT